MRELRPRSTTAMRRGSAGSRPSGASIRPTSGSGTPGDDGEVLLFDGALTQLLLERREGGLGLGHHQQAGGVAVQAVDEAGAQRVVELRELRPAADQRAGQCGLALARSGMHGEAGGLVEHHQVLVLEDHIKVDRHGDRRRGGLGRVYCDQLAEMQAVGGPLERALDAHEAAVDQLAHVRSRGPGQATADEDIEAFVIKVGEEFHRRIWHPITLPALRRAA